MKKVFYRSLITGAKDLTATERIIYSFLMAKSITFIDAIFDCNGEMNMPSELYEVLDDNNNCIELFPISTRKLEKELNISHPTICSSLSKLRDLGYITRDTIFVSKEYIRNGYFELYNIDKLTGNVLIFYSYLRDKAKKFNGTIDTYRTRLAEIFDVKIFSIDQYLAKLHRLKLVERLGNGKLLIL